MNSQFHYEDLVRRRQEPRYIEGWPPPRQHPPPGRRLRPVFALRLARLARRIDDRAAWRAFAP